ncbi:MAG: glycosyltransferase, partial [Pseudomonadota bacterium]
MPIAASWAERFRGRQTVRHDCFAFNFTELPGKFRTAQMRQAFKRLGQGFVLTEMERPLYSKVFGIPEDKLMVVPWGVSRPEPSFNRLVEGSYIAALGGEARDYAPLIQAARQMPNRQFVVVARPKNLAGLELPANIKTFTNLPLEDAWSVVAYADMHLLPLVSRDTPCGIVTAVGAMHLGKPQVVTASGGVLEYAEHGLSALGVEAGSAAALLAGIRKLDAEPGLAAQLGSHAQE